MQDYVCTVSVVVQRFRDHAGAFDDATWMSLTETALGPPPLVLGGSSSTIRGGAVGPSSSCTSRGERCWDGGGRREIWEKRAEVGCMEDVRIGDELLAGDVGDVAPSLRWRHQLPRCLAAPAESGEERGEQVVRIRLGQHGLRMG